MTKPLAIVYALGFLFCAFVASQGAEIRKTVLPDVNRQDEIRAIKIQNTVSVINKKPVTVTIRKGN